MASFLIIYGTGEGQTERVASRLADAFEALEHTATTVNLEAIDSDFDVTSYDAIVLGSSIHYGKHHAKLPAFIESHRALLEDAPTAFFQISLSSAVDDDERQALAAEYVETLLEETNWHPERIGLFGGALRYSEYGFLKRFMLKKIAAEATGDVDTSRDYEYTDWDEVRAFAEDFATVVEEQTN